MYSATKAHRIRDFRLVGSDGAPFHTSRTTYLPPGRASFSLPATTYLPPSPSAFHIWVTSALGASCRALCSGQFPLGEESACIEPDAGAAVDSSGTAAAVCAWVCDVSVVVGAPAQRHDPSQASQRAAASWTYVPTTAVNMSTREAGGGRLPTYLPAGSQPLGTDYLPTFTGGDPSLPTRRKSRIQEWLIATHRRPWWMHPLLLLLRHAR